MQRDRKIKLRLTVSLFVTMVFVSALFVRCASIETPSGGPVDSLPPVILAMTPNNFTRNMDTLTKRIYIEFDEFVQLVDQQTQFFTSPQMKNKPQLQIKGRGVVITLRDTLRDNTTYALNFGSSIRDNNEGNPLYSARYVFSTGDTIDSLIISGYTEDSYKSDSVSGTYILLYHKDSVEINAQYDSTIFNATPSVIARAENNGIFMAQNLKALPYYVYAMEDTNGNLTYEPGTDRVGFIDGTYNPTELGEFSIWYDSLRKYVVAEPQLHFRMFMDEAFKRQLLMESSRPIQHKAILNFGANHPRIDSLIFDSIPADRIVYEYPTVGRDTISLWFDMPAEELPDTIKGRVVYYKHDSLNELTLTTEQLKLAWRKFESKEVRQEREKQERERKRAEEKGEEWVEPEVQNPFRITMSEGEVDPEKSITLDLEYPLSMLDTSKLRLTRLTVEEQTMLEQQKKIMADKERLAAAEAALAAATDTTSKSNTTATPAETPAAKASVEYYGEPHPFTIRRDTQNIRRWHFETQWSEPGDQYYFTVPAGAMRDVAGFSNDSVTKKFTPKNKSNFGTIVVNLTEDKSTPSHYIVELLDATGSSVKEQKRGLTHGQVSFYYLPAGSYSLRVIQDLNNNGKWDAGNLIKRKQSERARRYQSEKGEMTIETKVNWEVEVTVDTKAMFAPESQSDLVKRLDRDEALRLESIEKARIEGLTKSKKKQ